MANRTALLMALVQLVVQSDPSAWVSAFHLSETSHKGVGVFSSTAMKAGEVLFEIPPALHVDSAFAARFLPSQSRLEPQLGIACYLALERFRHLPLSEEQSYWQRYVLRQPHSELRVWTDLMPSHVANAAYWTADNVLLVEELVGPRAMGRLHDLKKAFAEVQRMGLPLSYAELQWGYSQLLSRAFRSFSGSGSATLLPLVDLVNHPSNSSSFSSSFLSLSSSPSLSLHLVRASPLALASGSMQVRLQAPVSADTELSLHYGRRPPIQYFQMYGFMNAESDSEDSHDDISEKYFVFPSSASPVEEWKRGLYVSASGVGPEGLLRYMISAKLNESSCVSSAQVGEWTALRGSRWLSAAAPLCRSALARVQHLRAQHPLLVPLFRRLTFLLRKCVQHSND